MSLRTLSQNKFSNKRYNSSNTIFANYWMTNISGSSSSAVAMLSGTGGFKKIAKDSTGAIYIVGATTLGTGSYDAFLIKFNTSGAVIWQRAIGAATNSDDGQCIDIDTSDNIYVGIQYNQTTASISVTKFDTNGNLLAQIKAAGPTSAYFNIESMSINNSTGDIYIGGYYQSSTSILYGLIFRVDSALTTFYTTGRVHGTASAGVNPMYYGIIVEQSTGNLYTSGYRQSGSAIMLAKWDSSLSLIWSYTYNTGAAYNIAMDSSGYIYISGYYGTSSVTPFLCKLDNTGAVIWTRRLTGIINNTPHSITVDSSDNIFIMAHSSSGGSLVKFDSSGNIIWQNSLDSSAASEATPGLLTDNKNNIYVYSGNQTNSRVSLFYLPGDGTKTGTYVNTDTYTYSTSSLVNNISLILAPTSVSVPQTTVTPTITNTGMTSQSIEHTVSVLPIS